MVVVGHLVHFLPGVVAEGTLVDIGFDHEVELSVGVLVYIFNISLEPRR